MLPMPPKKKASSGAKKGPKAPKANAGKKRELVVEEDEGGDAFDEAELLQQAQAEEQDYFDEHSVEVMHFPSQVVGVRFYTGIVHRNEMVMLVREPQNPYDPNAIRVDNLSGIKVGYVNSKSGDAGLLSPLMDSGKVRLVANGDVKGTFTMPLSITVWALPEDIEWVLPSLPERVTAASSWGNGGGGVA